MRTLTRLECCPLCDGTVDVAQMASHLRALHEVAPGEPTIADVPVSKIRITMAQAGLERDEDLVETGAAQRRSPVNRVRGRAGRVCYAARP